MKPRLARMTRPAAFLLLLGAWTAPGPAQSGDPTKQRLDRSPRHHEWVQIKAKNDRTVRAFLVFPETSKPAPGVVVIHENRGLTDWVRGVADRLAEAGYVALAPDLLSGTGPDKGGTDSFASSDAAREGIYRLPPEQVTSDLDACVEHLRGLEATNKKVAIAGFCWGGAQSFGYAAHNPDLMGAFVFYGSAPAEEQLKRIKVPVFGFYGGNDFRITGQVDKVKEQMEKAHQRYVPTVYEGAGHAFMRNGEDTAAKPADREAQKKAWALWLEQLKELAGSRPGTRPEARKE
ncbi:MAG: hypothetical protein AMXMBFR13_13470 [Phycisphaerae bacterium]